MTTTDTATERLIRIGEVARGAGVSVRAVRYYEEQGLLIARRSPSGQRLYRPDSITRAKVDDLLAALDRLDEIIAPTDTHP